MAAVVLDLDGVIWLGDEPLPGAADAVARIRGAGLAVGFMTNNSSLPVAGYVEKLGRLGVAADPSEVLTSALAAADLLATHLPPPSPPPPGANPRWPASPSPQPWPWYGPASGNGAWWPATARPPTGRWPRPSAGRSPSSSPRPPSPATSRPTTTPPSSARAWPPW